MCESSPVSSSFVHQPATIDPNVCRRAVLANAHIVVHQLGAETDADTWRVAAESLAEMVIALDLYIRETGTVPRAWSAGSARGTFDVSCLRALLER